jgi:glutamine amidotransferase PdxT
VLAREESDPVLVRSGIVCGATFHPELSEDPAVHRRIFGPSASPQAGIRPDARAVSE